MLHNDVKSMICPAILLVLIPVLHVIKGWALDRFMSLMNDAGYIKQRGNPSKQIFALHFKWIYLKKKKKKELPYRPFINFQEYFE